MSRQPMELSELHRLWGLLSDVPIDADDCLEEAFLGHPAGTHREQVRLWFEDQNHNFKVGEMKRLTIAEALRDAVLTYAIATDQAPHEVTIWKGNPDLLHEAYERAGREQTHPLNTTDSVISAVRRSPLFERDGYIRAHTRTGVERQVLYATFKLRKEDTGHGGS